jgi:hypothetical protein
LPAIRDYPGFRDNNPISKTNYKCIIGDYNLPEEICCCFLKDSGKLCGEEHKKGWVVELQDGTVSIIGNVCAEAKFGADSHLIADQSRYINEKKRQEKHATLKQLCSRSRSSTISTTSAGMLTARRRTKVTSADQPRLDRVLQHGV